ncbi:MAG: beta-L-arabinofuranosidase domain-containing protein [Verrucomicrobiia bacterium]
MKEKRLLSTLLVLVLSLIISYGAAWRPANGPLMTRWAKDVNPSNAHKEYPRPQMERKEWVNLNGLWDYAIVPKDAGIPQKYDGKILVPFPLESALSGVMKQLEEKSRLWYRREFKIPADWKGKRVFLHFGAVDWETTVYLNGKELGAHRGGYDGFSFDITDALKPGGAQELVVAVFDPTDNGQLHGKQTRRPGGIMYTPTSGIWQTVWLEPVSETHIESIKIIPDYDNSSVTVMARVAKKSGNAKMAVDVLEGKKVVQSGEIATDSGDSNFFLTIVLPIKNFKPWSPDSPFLYDLKLRLEANGKVVDEVSSYFGMRKVSIGKDRMGITRILLNNEFVFQIGFLDQGFWPDGIYTAPTDEALRFDIEMTKKLGMNLARKHVKVEPERWYYWCDKLGLLVWQDMPSGDNRTPEQRQQYEVELERLINGRFNHPSIIMWVVFNEGWGQFDTEQIVSLAKKFDPTRLVNNASGWTDKKVGDVIDMHNYPGPGSPIPEPNRAAVLGEFGGLGLAIKGHTWTERSWGYQGMSGTNALTRRYVELLRKVYELKDYPGLSAAVYTQTTDVETECNGLMTYDRALVKPDLTTASNANRGLFPPPPKVITLVPTSEKQPVVWKYTFEKPDGDWFKPDYNDTKWKSGEGGFGTKGTPGSVVRTEWRTSDIWLRRQFELTENFDKQHLFLTIHHDEDAEVYINGELAAKLAGYTTAYNEEEISEKAKLALKKGKNTIAIHCKQTGGGQYIDAGLDIVLQEKNSGKSAAAIRELPEGITVLKEVNPQRYDGLYPANRPPLVPSPFVKLPIGSIQPKGWLRNLLELEKDGMTGHLDEISPWLNFEKSAWADPQGRGEFGWEEMPYWLKGYGDLGYVLRDEKIIAKARKWIEAAIASQREDGYFGPRGLLTSLNGKPDLWPHMIMLNVLQSYYEFTGDARIIDVMRRYMQWENQLPPSAFGEGYWPKLRMGDNIESVYWLYNHIGEPWLLDLAKKMFDNMARWDQDVINWHNVNIAQGFRAPAVFYLQSKDFNHLYAAERNYKKVMEMFGQFPGGGFAGDENCRPGFTDPRQGFETCGIVEFMHSFEMLTKISGNPIWSDRCEEIAFNSFPAALTPDLKALHYLTCANQVQCDKNNKSPGIENSGTMFSYSPFEVYRCCQHNVSHGLPYYAEELWLATYDKGLCASLYAPSEVSAKVGDGTTIKIVEETDYPFDEVISFKISTPKPVKFPLYLRIPQWCSAPVLTINGKTQKQNAAGLCYLAVNRQWTDGDLVTLKLPMKVTIKRWEKNKNAVSVNYGPLTFSLQIKERWSPYGKNPVWQEWEVFPESPWNYGLALDEKSLEKTFKVVKKAGALAKQPFTAETTPIEIVALGQKIPEWQMDNLQLVGLLQPSPAYTEQPLEVITLIPMGAARLRITAFPEASSKPTAHRWKMPPQPKKPPFKITASHVNPSDSLAAVADGLEPANSNDHSIPRFTWWNHLGTKEWIQFDFDKPRRISEISVYWFDDTGVGQCRVPQSWQLFYKDNGEWKPVETTEKFSVEKDKWNTVRFKPVETNGLRIIAQLREKFSGGILECKIVE